MKILKCFLGTMILALGIVFCVSAIGNGYTIKDVGRLFLRGSVYTVRDLSVFGYDKTEGNKFTSNCNDGYFYLPDIDKGVTNVVIEFDGVLQQSYGIVIYYNLNGNEFDEEHTFVSDAKVGEKKVEIPIQKAVHKIRIDIGAEAGDQFAINRIKVNSWSIQLKDYLFYWIILFSVFVLIGLDDLEFLKSCYKKRWWVACAVCVIAIVFELHGSSLNYWVNLFGNSVYSELPHNILGETRGIRGDDFAVLTSLALSQKYNNYGYFSDLIGINPMDVFIVYGQPVLNIAVLFRPSHWGYLLLGSAKGLSFFWIVRTVMLFMISWDFGTLLTNSKKRLALVYALGVTLAPVVQWWFSTNGFVEILFFGQLALILIKKYIDSDSWKKRAVLCMGICWCGCCYALVFYPAWQISFIFVFLAIAVWILREKGKFIIKKKDYLIWVGNFIAFGMLIAYIIQKSWGAIRSTLNTVYPGSRFETGGGDWKELFTTWTSIFFSHNQEGLPQVTNVCEASSFIDFAPLGLVLASIIIVHNILKKKQQDKLVVVLFVFSIATIIWCTAGFPNWLCRIIFLYPVTTTRGRIALQFAQWILLIRCLTINQSKLKWYYSFLLSVTLSIIIYSINISQFPEYYIGFIGILLIIISFGICIFLINAKGRENSRIFCYTMITFFAFSSLLTNPIVSGLDAIEKNNLLQSIKHENNIKEDVWAFEGEFAYMGTSLITVGAKSINCIHVYPDLEMWHIIDPDAKYEEIYNRYQHITLNVAEERTEFSLLGADYIQVDVTPSDIKKLGINKMVSRKELEEFDTEEVSFQLVDRVGDYGIYVVK